MQQPLHKARVHNGSRPNGTDVTSFGAPPQWFQKIDLLIRNIMYYPRYSIIIDSLYPLGIYNVLYRYTIVFHKKVTLQSTKQ